MSGSKIMIDGNEAASYVAHRVSEVCAIYPITPSSPMGEFADEWSAKGQKNIWGTIPHVVEMQSEGGASGAVHGALQGGALSTTFTASQGLLLMIPNMYKIAGELTPAVFHVAARSLAAQALSIFGDHSDVMAIRSTGFAMLASGSIQEIMDLALIAHAATLESRVPFIHFFDGFRSSSEVMKITPLSNDEIRSMINDEFVHAHRLRALSPDHPVIRGTAQNPDVFFQGRETVNPYYLECPGIVQKTMDNFAEKIGRRYNLFDYIGSPDAERVIVMMGSGAEAAHEAVLALNKAGGNVGLLKIRLYRPFSSEHFLSALPKSTKSITVLDRTKEPGGPGEPLYLDIVTAFAERGGTMPMIRGGRYGLSSKEFTPAMVNGVFNEMLKEKPKNHFTIGINDDVTHTSLDYDPEFSSEDPQGVRAVFYGLGADGTVGANKNSIKIIGDNTDNYAQGYFVYDSKKAGSITVSHLRFGPNPIRSTYLISRANFVACHQFSFLERMDVLQVAEPGATFLLNAPMPTGEVWDHLPLHIQEQIIKKKLKFYVIDGYKLGKATGMGNRINTIMQTCFFAISNILPLERAVEEIKRTIQKTYGRRGEEVVSKNYAAVDGSVENLHQIKVPAKSTSTIMMRLPVPAEAPEFVQKVTAEIIAGRGDQLPVSAMPIDGTFPTGTTKWEKRNISLSIPIWLEDNCIRCGKCVLVCPHSVIRGKIYEKKYKDEAPETFKAIPAKWKGFDEWLYTIQIAPEDCTGCTLCVDVCPPKEKALKMADQVPLRESERENWNYFLKIPEADRKKLKVNLVKDVQLLEPLFEFSGACGGCGETPYVKLLSQLFGDRALIANATGCSSIYGGNLPTTPYTSNADGRGPAWSNSLFEDNAEFGMGMRLAVDKQTEYARELLQGLSSQLPPGMAEKLLTADQSTEEGIEEQRDSVKALKEKLAGIGSPAAKDLLSLADSLVKRSVWILGGDGWAYDIGYGGL
ncbi:MAG: pyruvate:ferredoxin (flavodoxin) oxidoreductase, partial [Candidatus Eisenbacteria bacterium]|nr:pyruvate:ferredoxin (flavodoxin) oxidoreductase [Candidatus Eisenbacteria bacterium]